MIRNNNVILLIYLSFFSLFLSKKISNKITMYKNELNKSSIAQINKRIFSSICNNVSFKTEIIQANCNNMGTFSIDLKKCLANIDGKLTYKVNGGFENSCSKCQIKEISNPDKTKFYSLSCTCQNKNGVPNQTELNLNDLLYFNNNFNLICDDASNFKAYYENIIPKYLDEYCEFPKIENKVIFLAVCNNSLLDFDLNSCIGNFNGELALSENGKFGASCRDCYVNTKKNDYTSKKNIMITCYCKDTSQNYISGEYPLNRFIDFSQDQIVCANHKILKPKIEVVENFVVGKLPYNRNLSASDNFMISCKNIRVQKNNKLIASCGLKDIDDYEIDLDVCLSNIDGVLKVAKNGLFSKTCKDCKIKFDNEENYILNCSCQKINKTLWNNTFISLKERIIINENKNLLECLTNVKLPEDSSNGICLKS